MAQYVTLCFPHLRGAFRAWRRGGDSEGRSEEGDNPPAVHQPHAAQQAGQGPARRCEYSHSVPSPRIRHNLKKKEFCCCNQTCLPVQFGPIFCVLKFSAYENE